MDGSSADDKLDYDGDGLLNYQEYMCGSIYHWQFYYNNGGVAWQPDQGLYGYDPYDFFDSTISSNQWFIGPGGREPKYWDPHYIIGPIWHPVVYHFVTAAEHLTGLWFSSTDPDDSDTDQDGMDDFWEVYHGLNPLYGTYDIVMSKVYGADMPVPSTLEHLIWMGDPDVHKYPWVAGHQILDTDADELPNIFESLQQNVDGPEYHHTDPSPLWHTDTGSTQSWCNLYYWLGPVFGDQYEWYWDSLVIALFEDPPSWMYSFEINEGFDSDNDNIADRAELVHDPAVSPGTTDPLEMQSPIKRRALYLDGQSAARTRLDYDHDIRDFRNFTVEAWVMPENPASGAEQVLVERTGIIPQGNPMGASSGQRANFRVGIKPDGRPYCGYNGAGVNYVFVEAVADNSTVLQANNWYHLAAAYGGGFQSSGFWVGTLKLYVDGVLEAAVTSSEIPMNGWFGSMNTTNVSIGYVFPMPIVVGSGDANPSGWVDLQPILVGPYAGLIHSQPALHSHFKGWMDDVRIWSGERSQAEVQISKQQRFSRGEVRTLAGSGVLQDPPELRYYFTFDDLPDPDHSPITPDGFDQVLLVGAPVGYDGVPWWKQAPDRSTVYDEYAYIPWIENLVAHTALDTARDTTISTAGGTNRYPNTSNPYGFVYKHGVNASLEFHPHLTTFWQPPTDDPHYNDMLPLRGAVADEDVPMWDGGGTPSGEPFDTDGDGLPDFWEEQYGLDPWSGTGDNGAGGDPDEDGLSNWAEYQAGTSPIDFDTDNDGLGDYDSQTPGQPPNGELYTDGDGMDDQWEMQYPDATSPLIYDAHLDPDGDGWSNFAEFMWGTDPSDPSSYPEPCIRGRIEYAGIQTDGPVMILAYQDQTMDDVPIMGNVGGGGLRSASELIGQGDGQTKIYTGTLGNGNVVMGSVKVRRLNPAFLTPDVDFEDDAAGNWVHYEDYFSSIDATALVTFDYQTGDYSFTWPGTGLDGPWVNDTIWIEYDWLDGDVNAFEVCGLTEGDVYLFVYRDVNSDGTFNEGEPAGLATGQPLNLSWGDLENVTVGLTDDLPGYGRFAWTDTGADSYDIAIRLVNATGRPLMLERTVEGPRTFFHEGDYLAAGVVGLDARGLLNPLYEWFVDGVSGGYFSFAWPASLSTPILVSPQGGTWVNSQQEFVWLMDEETTYYELAIRRASNSELVYYQSLLRPWPQADGTFRFTPPLYAGDGAFQNDVYNWWIRPSNPRQIGAWSSPATFALNVVDNEQGSYTISGDALYYGQANASRIKVQAYESSGFSGLPSAQASLNNISSFALMGLVADSYYVMAFIDSNGNGELDDWESYGFHKNTASQFATSYGVGRVNVPPSQTGIELVIRDRDTDNDGLPDAWEYDQFGGLTAAGPGTVYSSPPYTDHDGDGLNDWKEYVLGSNPHSGDSDGDGIGDYDEVTFSDSGTPDTEHYDPYDPISNPGGTDLNIMKSDTDGDTLSDRDELYYLGMNPINPDDDSDGVPTRIEVTWDNSAGFAAGGDLDPMSADTDVDGVSDLMEIASGSDPRSGADAREVGISGISMDTAAGRCTVQWGVHSNINSVDVTYRVEYSPDLNATSWSEVESVVSDGDTDAPVSVSEVRPGGSIGYYRLRLTIDE